MKWARVGHRATSVVSPMNVLQNGAGGEGSEKYSRETQMRNTAMNVSANQDQRDQSNACLGKWVRRWRIWGVWSQQQLAFAFSLQCQLWAFVGKVNSKFILILIRGLCCQPWEFVIDFNRFALSSITDELKREKLGGEMGVAPAVHLLIGREKNANRAHTWSYVQRMGTQICTRA